MDLEISILHENIFKSAEDVVTQKKQKMEKSKINPFNYIERLVGKQVIVEMRSYKEVKIYGTLMSYGQFMDLVLEIEDTKQGKITHKFKVINGKSVISIEGAD